MGPYEILACIAHGGMATVWAARQDGPRGSHRLVALKTALVELSGPESESMFVEEARVAARIRHPNVCQVLELVEDPGLLALAMEWVDGDTLSGVLAAQDNRPLDRRIAAHIIGEVACGLHAAHELRDERGAPMRLVHRDVSPQNVLISKHGQVKVADFGVAKALGSHREVTEVGYIKGKPRYMSPEQACGLELDRRTDIFSLGILLYLATLGRHPFWHDGASSTWQIERLLMERIPLPSVIEPTYPLALEAIVMRALRKNPADRFSTAQEMQRALQQWVANSGPMVGELEIARMMRERLGNRIEERARKIQRCLENSQVSHPSNTAVPWGRDTQSSLSMTRRSCPPFSRLSRAQRTVAAAATIAGLAAAAVVTAFSPGSSLRDPTIVAARNDSFEVSAGQVSTPGTLESGIGTSLASMRRSAARLVVDDGSSSSLPSATPAGSRPAGPASSDVLPAQDSPAAAAMARATPSVRDTRLQQEVRTGSTKKAEPATRPLGASVASQRASRVSKRKRSIRRSGRNRIRTAIGPLETKL